MQTIGIVYTGPQSGCTNENGWPCRVNEPIRFSAAFYGGFQPKECDILSWTWLDGSIDTGLAATHAYTTAEKHTVVLRLNSNYGVAVAEFEVLQKPGPRHRSARH